MSKFSGSQVVKLGKRLRDAPTPAVADLEMLADVLLEYDHALMAAAAELQGIGLKPTTRLKTSGTIIEKLSRERHLNLKIIRDLAGARIVRRMTLDEQDQVAAQIMGIWPDAGYIDRRENPSHGYRAIHLVPRIGGCQVEIQLRTEYQDLWAQGMETFGDLWGRAIRYGGEPENPDDDTGSGKASRREMVTAWKRQADDLYGLAKLENEAARLRSGESSPEVLERLSALESDMNSRFVLAKSLVEGLRGIFD